MISPLQKSNIKGVVCYQGEAKTKNPQLYAQTFPAIIQNLRNKWHDKTLPFLFVQLAGFMEESNEPVESSWAETRQAQLETIHVPNTGMVVTTDIGEWNDIHPINKKDVGYRLAYNAFGLAYNDVDRTMTSPVSVDYQFTKKEVIVRFDFSGGTLDAKNDEIIVGFEVSADGLHFVKASAIINEDRVVVWNDPLAVRYAWPDHPIRANLLTTKGLPVSPFQIFKNQFKTR